MPLGCVVAGTLKRRDVGRALAIKIAGKLGGATRWTIAGSADHRLAGRSIVASLPEGALLAGVDFKLNDAYSKETDQSVVGVMLSTAAHDRFWWGTAALPTTAALQGGDEAAIGAAFEVALNQVDYVPSCIVLWRSGKGLR